MQDKQWTSWQYCLANIPVVFMLNDAFSKISEVAATHRFQMVVNKYQETLRREKKYTNLHSDQLP